MNDLRISLVQGDTRWHDPASNRDYYGALVAPLAGTTDLVVLPETFTSGFSNDAIDKAEGMDGPTVAWIRGQARLLDAVVTGSVQLRTAEGVFNRLLWAAPDGARLDDLHDYPTPDSLGLNQWALIGPWTFARHASVSGGPGARLDFRFHARDVNLVMGPAERGTPVPFRVRLDGAPPGAAGGFDLDASGEGTLDAQRLYQLIRVPDGVRERTVSIEFLGPGAEAYCYTFG